jgi:exonuclease SbcC
VVKVLEKVQLDNFVSHKSTTLAFDPGVTVFIGRNGSGKSSVIDAITFALYGQHTRGHNRNLVRRGSEGSMVQVNFKVDSKKYQATRSLDARGSLSGAKLEQVTDTGFETIAHGERRQMGEAMSVETSSIIGLDYDRLRVAAVVQQGELDAILKSKPSEFKELINTLIGIDKLDKAFQNMRDVIDSFRSLIRQRTGYDDQDLENVKQKITEEKDKLEESSTELEKLNAKLQALVKEEKKVKQKLDVLEPLSGKVRELEQNEELLLKYVKQKTNDRKKELQELEQLIKDAIKNIKYASKISEVKNSLAETRQKIRELELDTQKTDNEVGRLEGLLDCASRYLQPVDGKCPVCGSVVEDLKVKLDAKHIRKDLAKMKEDAEKKKTDLQKLKDEESKWIDVEVSAKGAMQFLTSIGIKNPEDVTKREDEAQRMREELMHIPSEIESVGEPDLLAIDDYSCELADKIISLRKELVDFDQEEYQDQLLKYEQLVSTERPLLEREIGRFAEISKGAKDELESLTKTLKELENVYAFINTLEKIRKGVYNRDGSVAMSLRSWALRMISQKASDYIAMFGLNVLRVELTEKARDVLVTCYGTRGAIDMESLSGGEKVAIALALRLGMAYVMGRGKLDFIILDEPTTHLDEERRRSLVRIITEAFKAGLGPLSQIVIITHDSEIFEDADVDSVYRFEMTADGTSVTRL